jgi:hypothetical protein
MRTRLIPIVLVIAALVVGACGGDDDAKVASLGDNDESTTTVAEKKVDPEDAALEFARCMRENGVDIPDPEIRDGGSSGPGVMIGGPSDNVSPEKFEAADKACRHLMEDAFGEFEPPSPEEQAKMRDEMLAFAKCMREHGIDMPDPTFDGDGRVAIRAERDDAADSGASTGPAFDFESDEFQAAQKACGDKLGGRMGFSGARAGGK